MKFKVISTFPIFGVLVIAILSLFYLLRDLNQPGADKELLIYCGITMSQPMAQIASIVEQREKIKISILKGGSGDLLNSIKFNQVGDLYLPGSESYIKQAVSEGLVSHTVLVGYNKAAMMVREGNPKSIPPRLDALENPGLYVVIGNPNSGSIGKETKKILIAANLFDQVMNNASELTTDSKRLVSVLKKGDADVVINWSATASWEENAPYIDAIEIDEKLAQRKNLILGLLTTSKHPHIARKLMDFATSAEGKEIFRRYGFQRID
jgi:molybdate transport system substrate-binding protein